MDGCAGYNSCVEDLQQPGRLFLNGMNDDNLADNNYIRTCSDAGLKHLNGPKAGNLRLRRVTNCGWGRTSGDTVSGSTDGV